MLFCLDDWQVGRVHTHHADPVPVALLRQAFLSILPLVPPIIMYDLPVLRLQLLDELVVGFNLR